MKKLLTLCTKNVHFSFNNEIYVQIDGVAMGSPLGLVIENIFMVELENTLVSKFRGSCPKEGTFCRWYVCVCEDWFSWLCSASS